MAGSRSQHELTVEIAGKIASSFGSAIGNVNKHMATLGKIAGGAAKLTAAGMAAAGTAIAGVVAASTNVGKEFEAQMSTVAAISGATGNELAALESKAKEMGATTQFSATEAGQAMEYMAMAGWKSSDMVEGISGIMNLAAASGEDLASTSDIVTDALTAFGLTASDSGKFADVLAAASSNANTNVSMLGESFKYVAPLAGTLGYSAEDASIALGLMANAGIKGSQAGTSLKTALANMSAPTDKQAAAMEKLGLSLTDGEGNMKSMREVMVDMRSSFAGLSEAEQTAAASTIFGKEAMSGMLAIINASEDDFNKLTNAIDNSSGAAAEMAAIRLDNLEGDITLLKSGLEGFGIEIYQGMNAPMREAAQLATEYVARMNAAFQEGGFSGMVEEIGSIVSDALLKIAEYAPDFIKMAATLIKALIRGISNNSGKLADSAAQVLAVFVNGIFEMIPQIILAGIDIVIQLAASISGQLPELINNGTQAITNFIAGIIERLPLIISTALTLVQTLVSSLGANAPQLIQAAIMLITSLITGIVQMLPSLVQMGIQLIMNLVQGILSNLPLLLQSAVQIITSLVTGIVQMLPMLIQSGIQLIISLIQGIIANLGNIVQAAVQIVITLAAGLIQAIPQLIAAIPQLVGAIIDAILNTNWIDVGIQIIKGLIDGIMSTGASLWSAIKSLFTGGEVDLPDTSGQSAAVVNSYASGIESNSGVVAAATSNMSANAFSTMDTTAATTAGIETATAFSDALNNYTFDTSGLDSALTTAGTNGSTALSEGLTAGSPMVVTAVDGMATDINTSLDSGWSTMQSSAQSAMSELTNTVQTQAQAAATSNMSANAFSTMDTTAATTAGIETATAFSDALNNYTFDTSGLDSALTTAGTNGSTALSEGLTAGSPMVVTAVDGMATDINTSLDSGWSTMQSSAQSAMSELTNTVQTQAQAAAQAVKSAFESMTITIPAPKIPKISVSTSSVSYGDGGSVSIPNFSVSYYAQGGIMDSPTLFGMVGGEAGPEGIIPLDPFWNQLDSAVSAAVENFGGVSQARQDADALSGMHSAAGGMDSRAKELYGDIAGSHTENISNDNSTSENSPRLVFSPQITIQGNASKEDVQSALSWSQEEFNRMMQEYNWQNGRTAMA